MAKVSQISRIKICSWLVNNNIRKLSYDLDLAHKIRNKVSFLQLINHVGCSWVREKHKQSTTRNITLDNAKELKYAHAILDKYSVSILPPSPPRDTPEVVDCR
jgi:hypothetical protein